MCLKQLNIGCSFQGAAMQESLYSCVEFLPAQKVFIDSNSIIVLSDRDNVSLIFLS